MYIISYLKIIFLFQDSFVTPQFIGALHGMDEETTTS